MRVKTSCKTKPPGFTLIELLVVIAIIAILAGLLFPVLGAVMERMRKTQAVSDSNGIILAVRAYSTEYGKYPVDLSKKTGDAVYSTDNNALIDVLRNVTGGTVGNALNPRNTIYLSPKSASNQARPTAGLETATGVWFDPWGSPYNIAVDSDNDGVLNSSTPLPNFYTDAGPLQQGVIVWAFGKNGALGGGPASTSSFSSESGTPGKRDGSGDVVSW